MTESDPRAAATATVGPGNPHDLGASTVELHECAGRVLSVRDFTKRSRGLLSSYERSLVSHVLDRLPDSVAVRPPFNHCLCRADGLPGASTVALEARRSGARSAYVEAAQLKLKGCRPVQGDSSYPTELLPFGAREIERSRLPFGVLTEEGVMREILAYAFHLVSGLEPHGVPVCVYAYRNEGSAMGFCLLMETAGENRVEALVEYPDLAVRALREAVVSSTPLTTEPLGSELRLRGLNLWWYVEAKSRLLIDMHGRGGFRGVLNSNIGNDVLVRNPQGQQSLLLCDFDSFHALEVPDTPSLEFLEPFILNCLIEVVKGSLSILDYLELPDDLAPEELGEALAAVYFTRSSLWYAYRRRLSKHARDRGWDYTLLEPALRAAIRTKAVASVLGERILNNHFLQDVSRERGVYYPHN